MKAFLFMLPGSSDSKESTCNARDLGLIPGLGRFPGEGHGNPLQYSCLKNSHGQRTLTDYSPWGLKELDTTESQNIVKKTTIFKDSKLQEEKKKIVKQDN